MASLTIRNLPDKVRDRLRLRAARRGVSMEAEVRAILARTVEIDAPAPDGSAAVGLQDWIASNRRGPRGERTSSEQLIRDRRRAVIMEVLREDRDPREVFGAGYDGILAEAKWTDARVRTLARKAR